MDHINGAKHMMKSVGWCGGFHAASACRYRFAARSSRTCDLWIGFNEALRSKMHNLRFTSVTIPVAWSIDDEHRMPRGVI